MAAKKKTVEPVIDGVLTPKQAAQEAIKCLQVFLQNRENPEPYRKHWGDNATWRNAFAAAEGLCETFSKEPAPETLREGESK